MKRIACVLACLSVFLALPVEAQACNGVRIIHSPSPQVILLPPPQIVFQQLPPQPTTAILFPQFVAVPVQQQQTIIIEKVVKQRAPLIQINRFR